MFGCSISIRDVLRQLWLQPQNANSIAGAIVLVLICGYVQIAQEHKQHGIRQVLLKRCQRLLCPSDKGPLEGLVGLPRQSLASMLEAWGA